MKLLLLPLLLSACSSSSFATTPESREASIGFAGVNDARSETQPLDASPASRMADTSAEHIGAEEPSPDSAEKGDELAPTEAFPPVVEASADANRRLDETGHREAGFSPDAAAPPDAPPDLHNCHLLPYHPAWCPDPSHYPVADCNIGWTLPPYTSCVQILEDNSQLCCHEIIP